MLPTSKICFGAAAWIVGVTTAGSAAAQTTSLRFVSTDGSPVPFVWVRIRGGITSIADEQGVLDLGKVKGKSLLVESRRIGYQPSTDTLHLPDTASAVRITLHRSEPGRAIPIGKSQLELVGFYDRWMQKLRGGLRDVTFIGPEMIDEIRPASTMDLLDHINGVTLVVNSKGQRAATQNAAQSPTGVREPGGFAGRGREENSRANANVCYMTVIVDGGPVCPSVGCHYVFANDPPGSTRDDHGVDLDKIVPADSVMAIEVYPRRDGMPADVLKEYNGCGVIAVWTGRRR